MTIETDRKPLNVAIVRFPGSNCDFDSLRFFQRRGHSANFLWHKETEFPENTDLLFLPGGFAFGDRVYERATGSFYIDPGIKALESPVMQVVYKFAELGKKIWGVCNGNQILVHAGLLPGELTQNGSGQFFCDDVDCIVEGQSIFGDQEMVGQVYRMNVAHGYGRYFFDKENYDELVAKGQIILRYIGFNPNGSFENVAGVCNEGGNILGTMPHPERATPEIRTRFLEAIERYVRN